MSDSKPAPPVTPQVATPGPPRTKSGELPAVRAFQKEVEKYNDETVPKLDEQVDRMTELLKSVTPAPDAGPDSEPTPSIPGPPRTPSTVDDEERGS